MTQILNKNQKCLKKKQVLNLVTPTPVFFQKDLVLTKLKPNLLYNKWRRLKNKLVSAKKYNLMWQRRMACCVRINYVANNLFCTFWSISNKKTIRVRSAGMKKIKISKRRLFFYSKSIITSFLKEVTKWKKKYRNNSSLLFFSLHVPKRLRSFILKSITLRAAAINFEYSKAFNGCKAKKKRRKKRLGFRNFK